jgi:DNA-binding response OmpR family regulator
MDNHGKTILIIDDDADFHTLVSSLLKKSGYTVLSLFDGSINNIFGLITTCDMVLLDVELPVTDGVEIGKQLKSDSKTMNIPIIMITGHSDSEKVFLESKANFLVQKPFMFSGLLAKINEYFIPGHTR